MVQVWQAARYMGNIYMAAVHEKKAKKKKAAAIYIDIDI